MDVTPSHEDNKESEIVHNDLKICLQNKKIIKNIKSGG